MRIRGHALCLGAVIALLLATPLAAQNIVLVRQLSFPLMDFGLVADSVAGAEIVAAPGVHSEQGSEHNQAVWLRFNPDSLIPWLDIARAYLDAAGSTTAPDGIRWAPTLSTVRGSGGVTFGRMIYHGEPRAQRYLLVADSVHQWKLEISAEEASKLLNGLLEVASLSRLNADSLSRDRRLDVNPSVKSQPAPTTGLQGRVVYLVMVDSTGVADMGTYSTVIASDSLVEADARRVAAGSRFKPGIEAGHPVRVLVCQTISWLLGPAH